MFTAEAHTCRHKHEHGGTDNPRTNHVLQLLLQFPMPGPTSGGQASPDPVAATACTLKTHTSSTAASTHGSNQGKSRGKSLNSQDEKQTHLQYSFAFFYTAKY